MDQQSAKEIIDRYLLGHCTPEEQTLVERFYLKQMQTGDLPENIPVRELKALMWENVAGKTAPDRPQLQLFALRKIAFWAAILAFTLGLWFYYDSSFLSMFQSENTDPYALILKNDIPPGKNTATLHLANGKDIPLSDAKTGVVIYDSNVQYNDQTHIGSSLSKLGREVQMLSVNTPRGGQYQVVLPDGTKAWLNSASSIQFPSAFGKTKNRTVSILGEIYFEVAKDPNHPFIVKSSNQDIEVLGTHFNVHAHPEEPLATTTLLEGSVLVQNTRLRPGEQALNRQGKIQVAEADTAAVMAWRNGYFSFQDTPIQEVMESLSRWYNIEYELGKELTKEGFTGKFSRSRNISEVLKMLTKTGKVHFTIAGRRVVVQK